MTAPICWLYSPLHKSQFDACLEEHFHVVPGTPVEWRATYYDTFEWSLYQKGLRLLAASSREGFRLELADSLGNERQQQKVNSFSGFPADLPEGDLRSRLVAPAGLRRLLPILELEGWSGLLKVKKAGGRAVLEFELECFRFRSPGGKWTPPLVRVGVGSHARLSPSHLGLREELQVIANLVPSSPDRLDFALQQLQIPPVEYSSKIRVHLDRNSRADVATKVILRSLLDTMLLNREGTVRNLDTEFLHDFRVSVRRTRSALSQIKGVLPPTTVRRFRREFGWLGTITGPTRDLDVYLLNFGDYRNRLAEAQRADLDPLHRFLEEEHRREQARLAILLAGRRCDRILKDWGRFLERPVPAFSSLPHACQKIGKLASKRVWRAYRRVRKKGMRITDESPPEDLHQLRIDCKKLRYLLEFFQSLYEGEELQALIRDLKNLQDCLGNLNDFQIQQISLQDFSARMRTSGLGTPGTYAAIVQLSEGLQEMKIATRQQFTERFGTFSAPENHLRFRHLFSGKKNPDLDSRCEGSGSDSITVGEDSNPV